MVCIYFYEIHNPFDIWGYSGLDYHFCYILPIDRNLGSKLLVVSGIEANFTKLIKDCVRSTCSDTRALYVIVQMRY